MVELDVKRKIIIYKIIPTVIFFFTCCLRFLDFYEYPGITVRSGWSAPILSKKLFLISVLIFFIATWKIKQYIVCLLLQIGSLAVIMYSEVIFADFAGFVLKRTLWALWLDVAIMVLLQLYCIFITVKKSKHN